MSSSIQKVYAQEISTAVVDNNLLPLFLARFDRSQTRRAYQNDLVQFFGTTEITIELVRSVTFVDVNDYLAQLETSGGKTATIKRRLAALRGFFVWLLALEVITRNPTDRPLLRKVNHSRRDERAITVLTAQQAQVLIDAASDDSPAALRDRTLLITMIHCVLRRSEAAAMNVEHIRPLGHYWVLDLPFTKGGADQWVKIPATVVEDIEDMKTFYGITEGPLWRSLSNRKSSEGRLTPHSIYRIVQKAADRAGITQQVGAHTLRHTGCTLAIEAGASLQQVKTHARHKKLETTMIYVHQRDKLRDSAADFIHLKH